MAAQQNNSAMAIAQQNAAQRAALIATAPRMRKNISTVTAEAGQTSRVKLFNVGILTKLQIYVTAALTIGTANAVASTKAPYNLISRIKLADYDGTDRVSLSGFQLFMLNAVRDRSVYGYHNSAGVSAAFTNPSVPVAVGNVTVSFFLDIPVAFDVDNPIIQLQDLRGAIMAQTAVGEMYLVVDWISSYYANGDVDSLYSGAGTTTVVKNGNNNISMVLWQEYMMPQNIGNNGVVPLPYTDLTTVYELNGYTRSSDNIAVNTDKLLNYPNLRSVIGAYFNYVQATTMTQGKINTFKLLANGNTVVREHTETSQLFEQRKYLLSDADLVPGAYFISHRDKPIETALFGSFQAVINPSTVGATPYIEYAYESFFTKGAALPGVPQAG